MNEQALNPAPYKPQLRLYQEWLSEHRGLTFATYDDLWRWSVTDLSDFWQSIWDYFELQSPTLHEKALVKNVMPGAQWFSGAKLNYTKQVFRHVNAAHQAGFPALISENEKGQVREITWPELRRQVAALALHLRSVGVEPGDRVVAYLPNSPEAVIALLATASIGAIWSICAPDMGTNAVLDRFRQIQPKVLIACDGVYYAGKVHDKENVVHELQQALTSVEHVLIWRNLRKDSVFEEGHAYTDLTSVLQRSDEEVTLFEPTDLAFDHPLWIVYSSGTTGLPKPIVHGHGGTIVVALALKILHNDVGCSYHPNSWAERYHWYSSTGWVMWNAQVSGLLNGTTCVIYDGNPAGNKDDPDWRVLWRFAAKHRVTFFGAGAASFTNCMKAGIDLSDIEGIGRIRALGTTGSPLSEEVQSWGVEQFKKINPKAPDIWWCNISGGTDFAGAFIGGNRELPQHLGQMQCRLLGCSVQAWNEQGQPVVDQVGELVCTQPIPSMPLYFWGDERNERYLSSYFDMYPAGHGRAPMGGDAPAEMGGVWRHGDWLKILENGACIIYGRSDATINRHGLRMGTSELYSAVESLDEILDSMVVDLEYLGRESYMPLFVVLRSGLRLTETLKEKINQSIRSALSPRFIPNEIFQVEEIPRTLTGKKQELPIKKLLLGQPIEKVVNQDTMANPSCLDWYVAFAQAHRKSQKIEMI
jgi:acetoacetyl-CoA synthetase